MPAAGDLRTADFAQLWRDALARPADARHRVLVALERNRVVGFAITTPATDPDCDPVTDGELMELTVDAGERGKGHGSRLLQAAVDTMVADRFTRAVTWLVADDDALRAFLTDAGWAPDTAHRELDGPDGARRSSRSGCTRPCPEPSRSCHPPVRTTPPRRPDRSAGRPALERSIDFGRRRRMLGGRTGTCPPHRSGG